jgi:hypothetical protein
MNLSRSLVFCFVLIVCLSQAFTPALAGDNLSTERNEMKTILNVVSKELEKNFYDQNMKGLDWRGLTEQAKQKIDNAKSVADIMRAIFVLVEKLGDSHTRFLPPSRMFITPLGSMRSLSATMFVSTR